MDKTAYGFGQNAPQVERQTIGADLASIENSLIGLRQNLGVIHDRIHGPVPTDVGSSAGVPSQALNHTVQRIKEEVQSLCELAYSLSESL